MRPTRRFFSSPSIRLYPPTGILSDMVNQFADDGFDLRTSSIGGGLLAASASH